MYQKKRRNNWVVGILAVLLVIVLAGGSVVLYAHSHESQLLAYGRSLGQLPEVAEVLSVSEFMGDEAYIVARVRLIDGGEQIYFVQDNVVVQQINTSELVSADTLMNELFGTTDIVRYSLGRYLGEPVYELVANTESGVNYVLADALTGEIVLSFIVD